MSHPQISMPRSKTQRQPRQQGAVLVCVVVCLSVTTLLLAGMLKRTWMTRRQVRIERHARQAEWLVQAGAERAAFRLASDAGYTGETWTLAAEAIVGTDPGAVEISVKRNATNRAIVQVIAEYPSAKIASIRRTREFLIDLPQTNDPGE